ncbi:MAG: hypothetical protein JW810_09435 [Sedimentisphaerales bacterium]|nr:hypothetical protein [Sedimentisphaerales bacterium]
MKMGRTVALGVALIGMVAGAITAQAEDLIYQTDFDALDIGPIQHHPGVPEQDYWYYISQDPDSGSIGEIQDAVANTGRAFHEHAGHDYGSWAQIEDSRDITPAVDINRLLLITLQVDFYAHTSDPNTDDFYTAQFRVWGGPHPGYEIVAFGVASGNGTLKKDRKLDLDFAAFNGSNNNYVFTPSNGRTLEWDAWHTVTVVIDQYNDRYVSVTVDGVTEDVSQHPLPRNELGGVWKRGQLIDLINSRIICNGQSDDDIYWDNLSVTAKCILRADLTGDCAVDLADFAIMAAEWLMGT